MIRIQDTVVSLDLIERFFCCDLSACLGSCCIEGDAGAPVSADEVAKIEDILPRIAGRLLPQARQEVENNGVAYVDEEGDLVTSLINGGQCAFSTIEEGGVCLCAIEKAWRDGEIDFIKPISCRLYPVRLTEYSAFTAVNFHHWKICKPAETLGRAKGIRAYEFLREPLVARFGQEWYDELDLTAKEYLKSKESQEL